MNTEPESAPATPNREEALFAAALALAPAERAAFLSSLDPSLRQRLESLLKAYNGSDGFLESPPVPPAASTSSPNPASASSSPNPTIAISTPPSEGPGDVIGHYKIREKLGEGGCGVVYVAEQTEPVRRRVALKVIKLGMDTKTVIARFDAERQALAMMDHPNIAKVLDAGTTSTGRPYFVMELVRGIKITEYCDQNNLDTSARLQLFVQVCHAVQHAHQKGIIHRDIKPSNILVTLHDGQPVPKVIDFGIAKATEGRLTDQTVYTQLYEFIGTPAYISPEQAEMSGLDIDTRSDIYSLGVLLYELLTGKTPFEPQELLDSGLDGMRKTIRESDPPAPSTRLHTMLAADLTATAKRRRSEAPQLVHLVKGDLDWIAMKALEKDRTRRYDTANALAADLKRFLANEPIEARPPSAAYRFQKLIRRNKLAFAAAAGIAAALILGLAVSLNLYLRERAAMRQLQKQDQEEIVLRRQAEHGLELERRDRERDQIGMKLWRAGVLMSQEKFDEAEALMVDAPPLPQCAAIYNVLGMYHARWRRLDRAITNYVKAATVQATNAQGFIALLPLLVETARTNEFAQWRSKMLDQFAHTAEPDVAEAAAMDCLLLPPPSNDLDRVLQMIDTAESAPALSPPRPQAQLVRAFAEYRQGRFADAATRLQPAIDNLTDDNQRKQARLILALAERKLGHPSHPGVSESDCHLTGADWDQQTITLLLAREAASLP